MLLTFLSYFTVASRRKQNHQVIPLLKVSVYMGKSSIYKHLHLSKVEQVISTFSGNGFKVFSSHSTNVNELK